MMRHREFYYKDKADPFSALRWITAIVCLFAATFVAVNIVYSLLRDLAQSRMWPALIEITNPVNAFNSVPVIIGSELLFGALGCLTLGLGIWAMKKILRRKSLKDFITTAPKFRWKRFWAGCAVYAAIFAAYWFVLISFAYLNMEPGIFTEASVMKDMEIEPVASKRTFWAALPVVLIFTPLNAALQEVAFRGFVDRGMVQIIPNKLFAFILAGIIFAAWHYGSNGQYFGWFGFYMGFVIFAICMSLITDNDQGLEAAIGVHVANNLLAAFIVGSPFDGFSATYLFESLKFPNYGALSIVTDVLMYGACLVILLRWNAGLSGKNTHA